MQGLILKNDIWQTGGAVLGPTYCYAPCPHIPGYPGKTKSPIHFTQKYFLFEAVDPGKLKRPSYDLKSNLKPFTERLLLSSTTRLPLRSFALLCRLLTLPHAHSSGKKSLHHSRVTFFITFTCTLFRYIDASIS